MNRSEKGAEPKGAEIRDLLKQASELAGQGRLVLKDLVSITEAAQSHGLIEDTVKLYQRWLATSQDLMAYIAWFNLGAILQSVGLRPQAIQAYKACLEMVPLFPVAVINLGLCYEGEDQHELALDQWQALADAALTEELMPGIEEHKITAINHSARLLEDLNRFAEAEAKLEVSLRKKPGQPDPIHHWVHLQQRICKWPIPREIEGARLHEITLYTSPLPMLALSDDPLQQMLTAREFVRRKYGFEEQFLSKGRKYQHSRLRVGYVSGDLCTHAVGLLMPPVLEGHDRTRIEVYGYDYSPEDGTVIRERLKAGFDHFRDIRAISDAQVIAMILDDEIDVLIDLHGLSQGARPAIFAAHPAPLQGQFLGYIGTTGMPWHDFVVTDRFVFQEHLRAYYTEAPLFVDGCFLPLESVIPADKLESSKLSRSEIGLPSDRVILAALNNSYKITKTMFSAWAEILRRAPDAVIWLIDDNPLATANLKAAAKAEGLTHDRLCFTRRLGYYQYAASLTEADLYLDTFPYNCGSTARDVVLAGLPMVSMAGQSVVSRMASSAISATPEIDINGCTSVEAYIEKALHKTCGKYALLNNNKDRKLSASNQGTKWRYSSFDAALFSVVR